MLDRLSDWVVFCIGGALFFLGLWHGFWPLVLLGGVWSIAAVYVPKWGREL